MPFRNFETPDQRLRRLEGHTQREIERKQELDLFEQRRTQEIEAQTEQERARGLELDQSLDIETERARGLDLDRRRQPSTITGDFPPSPSPSGRFVDRVEGPQVPTPAEVRQDPMGVSLQRKARTGEPLTPEELDVAFKAGYNISYSTGQPRIGIDPTPAQAEALTRGISPERPEFPPFDIGAPAGEPVLPGVAGKIPGLRTPAELGATIATLGVGGPLIGPATALTGSAGALAGGELGEEVAGPTGRIVGEVVGGLGGGFAGGMAARPLAGAVREAVTDPALRRTLAAEAGGGPLRGGEVDPHITQADPGPPPPPKEPPPSGPKRPSPDDPEFRGIQDVALKGEKPEETLIRRHDGAINTAKREAEIEVVEGNKLLRDAKMGQSFRGTVVPKVGQVDEFDELYRFLHNPSKVQSGEMVVPERLRPAYDKLRAQTDWEQAARLDFDPEMALVEDYFFRGWKPPEGMFIGEARGALGRRPGFKMPRVNATFEEMRAAGFEPLFWNPFEQQRFSRLMGVKYREQMRLIDDIKALELALPHDGGPIPNGWRVPKVGPAFEGKPFGIIDNAGNARPMFTRRWAVPDSLANRLENAYGVTPNMGKGEIFGKTIDFQKAVDAAVFIPKRAKLIASVFQHIDFATRSYVGAWSGFLNALRHGQPLEAATHLAKWPKSAGQILRATVSPGYRQNLRRMAVDNTPLFKDRPGLSMKSISEAGLSQQDVTILPDIDTIAREAASGSKAKAALGQVADLERLHRQGLFQGVYPAAILTDVKNNIAPMIVRNYPNETAAQLAGRIAKAANTKYSTIPGSMSVVQNRFMRNFLTRFFFSMGEQEGLLRAFTGAVRGENAAFWREHLLGAYIGLIAAANVIHFASTGEPLPLNRYSPISKDKWGPLPFGYNTDFAAPNIPLTGRSGTQVTLDLVGQLDTAFRLLDPASFLSSRESVPVRAGLNQITGKDFFGAPIDTVGPEGVVSRTSQFISDLFAPIGFGQSALQLARSNIEGAEGIIQPGEDRLGIQGTLAQATGINLRAETTPQLLDRIRDEVMREKGIEGTYADIKATDAPLANEIDDEVEVRIGQELELRRETAEIRGQTTPQGQGFQAIEATREAQQTEQLADDAKLNSRQWEGDIWREKFRDRQRGFFSRREQIKADFQIEFDDKEAPSASVNAAIDAYFDVNVDDYAQPDGTTDWDGFFGAQDAALAPLSSSDKKRVMKFIHKFDTPTVTEFRKAQDIMDRFFDTPKYVGLSLKQGEEVDRVLFELAPALQTRFEAQTGEELTRRDAVRHLAAIIRDKKAREFLLEHFGGGVQAGLRRIGAGGGLRRITDVRRETDEIRNEKRDQILVDNEVILARFYNDVLERELSREQQAGLLPTTLEALFGPMMELPDIERRGLRRITAGR